MKRFQAYRGLYNGRGMLIIEIKTTLKHRLHSTKRYSLHMQGLHYRLAYKGLDRQSNLEEKILATNNDIKYGYLAMYIVFTKNHFS